MTRPVASAGLALPAVAAPAASGGPPDPFFVFDNGLNDAAHCMLAAKTGLLRELGHAGVGWRPGEISEMRAEPQRNQKQMTLPSPPRTSPPSG